MLNSISDDVTTALTLKGTGRVCKENHPYKKVKKNFGNDKRVWQKVPRKTFFSRHSHTHSLNLPCPRSVKTWKNCNHKSK